MSERTLSKTVLFPDESDSQDDLRRPTGPESLAEFGGIRTRQALAMTEPLATIDAEMLVRPTRADTVGARLSGLRHLTSKAWEHRWRLALFAVNGMNVFAVGLLIQVILVQCAGMGHVPSYIVQTIASVQLSFLLSRYLIWRDRDIAFLRALARFNLQQFTVTGLGIAAYAGLEHLGVNFIAANMAVTALLAPASFLSDHLPSMTSPEVRSTQVTAVAREAKPVRRSLLVRVLPLIVILIVQSTLSLRLVWANTAFTDEALYLRSGHLEIQHWLYGVTIPAFPTYFSGSPVIYPPIGALADSIGGLAAARILSLCFMLGATSFLWATARRLHGGRGAFFAAALFAVLGPTVRLGAFATYDAMSLCLVGLATWCAVRAGEQQRSSGWLAGAALALALANAAKYASGLFDPVIFAVLVLQARQVGTWKQAVFRGLTQVGYTVGILVFLLALGGSEYITGVEQTTLARASSTSRPSQVFGTAWQLTAVLAVMAAAGMALVLFDRWQSVPRRLLILLMACTISLVPIEQARIQTLTSLNKHVDFGAWFAAITAGYAVDLVIRFVRFRTLRWVVAAALTALLVPAALLGLTQAQAIFRTWPNSAAITAKLRQVLPDTSGPILDDNNRAVPEYYLPQEGSEWYRWSNNSSLRLPDGKSESVPVGQTLDPNAYVSRIHFGYFSVVILSFTSATAFDDRLLPALAANPHYHLVAAVPYGGRKSQIWEYEPQRGFEQDRLAPHNDAGASPLGGLLTPVASLRPILGTITDIVIISGLAVLLLTIVIRVMWRRGKESYEV